MLNCILIENDSSTAAKMRKYLENIPFINLTDCCTNAIEAMKVIRNSHIDIAFINIRLPEMSGVEFAKMLPETLKVIFLVDNKVHAIEGYQVNAVDCLMNPANFEDTLKAAAKAKTFFSTTEKTPDLKKDSFIFIKSDYKVIKVNLSDILYIEGVKDYVKFYIDNGKQPIMSLMNMKELEKAITGQDFMRIHRSYIANLSKMDMIERMHLVYGELSIPISESYKENVLKYVAKHSI
ncbi:MAG: response regulator transcription factor [Prevotella sp.]|nr:response regulator transcription factor [Prevotella sp.]MBP8757364.1 response regulator transcription factor [Prevotella sp.]MBP9985058.1 response regulator transcription factor [Prevotella sp.]